MKNFLMSLLAVSAFGCLACTKPTVKGPDYAPKVETYLTVNGNIFRKQANVFVDSTVGINYRLSGQFPIQFVVVEVLGDDLEGELEVGARTLANVYENRVGGFASQWSQEYYTQRVLSLYKSDSFDASIRHPDEPQDWDGFVNIEVVVRAITPQDFQGKYGKEYLEELYGDASGRIFCKSRMRVRLSCPQCQV